jgi:hypothetical protein
MKPLAAKGDSWDYRVPCSSLHPWYTWYLLPILNSSKDILLNQYFLLQ